MNQDWSQSLPTDDASVELTPPPVGPTPVQTHEAQPTGAQPTHSPQAETALLQIQNRLLNLSTQIEHIQNQLEHLTADAQVSGEQVTTLTRHLTDPQRTQTVDERLAELTTQITVNQEQLETLAQTVTQTANRGQVERLLQIVANTASQEHVQRLTEVVASQAQVAQLEDALKKLMRTQFKANTLGESKEQQVASALATLQEMATRREKVQTSQNGRDTQQRDAGRNDARAELAAELLPALDSLELALDNGETLLERQRNQVRAMMGEHTAYVAKLADYAAAVQVQPPIQTPAPVGFWQRLFGDAPERLALPGVVTPPPPPAPQTNVQDIFESVTDATKAWLQGLELVRDRFHALLAGEGIQPIEALNKPFDPRQHVAVEAEARSDVPANTIVRVLRKGYRQQNRILRYAEVVVARTPE